MNAPLRPATVSQVATVSRDDNPHPASGRFGQLTTDDDFILRHARWHATAKPFLGTILLMQGRTEFIEKYYETISDLRGQGYDVLTFDWRGQGGSTRHTRNPRRGYVESYDEYARDVEAIVRQVLLPDCRAPYFGLAHSMGGLIALYHAEFLARQLDRMVLCAPFVGFQNLPLPPGIVRVACSVLMTAGLGEMFVGGGPRPEAKRIFQSNVLTSDETRFLRNRALMMEAGPMGLGGPTVAWTRATIKAQRVVKDPDHFLNVRTPILMVGAADDAVSSNRDIEILAASMRSGSLITLPGARHEIMQETDKVREQLWAVLAAFLPGTDLA